MMLFKNSIVTILLLFSSMLFAQTQDASPGNVDQIKNWATDGVTKIINVPAGTYNFSTPLFITNNDLEIRGAGKNNTFFKLTAVKNTLVDAIGDNAKLTNLTLDGMDNQKGFGNPIFRFNKSKGHRLEHVILKNSIYDGVGPVIGYATDGLFMKNCVFTNVDFIAVNILNRNTEKRGSLVTSVDRVIINKCTFNEGYLIGVTSDCGNDRVNNGGTGRRYIESTSLNGTVIKNCMFKRTKKFHIAMVQSSNMLINNNTFEGITEQGEPKGAESLHFEQFTKNVEIYNNTFFMSENLGRKYNYMLFGSTEGHKRVTQQQPSNTYKDWTYNYFGGNSRRASTSCAAEGNTNKDCKRDVHAYGPRAIYIAGNTFNASTKILKYLTMKEAENIVVGKKKNGTTLLNDFKGGTNTTSKISLNGHDEGSCNVVIEAGQNIVNSNVSQGNVSFDLSACRNSKPNKVGGSNLPSIANSNFKTINFIETENNNLLSISPNPAKDLIQLSTTANSYTITISDLSGNTVKTISGNQKNKIIDVSSLTQGLYIMILTSDIGDTKVEKLVIN